MLFIPLFRLQMFAFCSIYQQDTHLIQQPHRQRHEREREHVRSRRDDSSHHENNHDGMSPIAAHEVCGEESQFGKQSG